ncbi:MAG TPA: CPBP family intramembrane glutamic endopeptidase [Candidatus Thermoplasmatota archaeon]|nr:CPBP family intramembrane glutamic endopeptidase [Candidatus Thermoplasmatota archaeon]
MPALTRDQYDVLVVLLSWTLGFLPLFVQQARGKPSLTWVQSVGIALVATPFVRMLLNIYLSIGALFTFTVLEPVSREALWRSVGRDVLFDLAFPLAGLLLLHNAVPRIRSRRAAPGGVDDALRANGLAPKHSWARDAARGSTLFFVIAFAYLVALAVSSRISPALAGGDESAYWRNITLPLIVLVSGMAGITEEILFRGILLSRLARWMPFALAALVQALFFGFIHAGYGTWTHVLAPAVFGLGMAWVARVLGILPAILLHTQVNIVYFAMDVSDVVPQAWIVVLALGIVNIWAAFATRFDAIALLWGSLARAPRRLAAWLRREPAPEPEGELDAAGSR